MSDNKHSVLNSLKIKNIRSKLGKTQEEFAKLIGVSKNSVQLWETGKINPSQATMILIEDTFKKEQESKKGKEPKLTSDQKKEITNLFLLYTEDFINIPIIKKYIDIMRKEAQNEIMEEILNKPQS